MRALAHSVKARWRMWQNSIAALGDKGHSGPGTPARVCELHLLVRRTLPRLMLAMESLSWDGKNRPLQRSVTACGHERGPSLGEHNLDFPGGEGAPSFSLPGDTKKRSSPKLK